MTKRPLDVSASTQAISGGCLLLSCLVPYSPGDLTNMLNYSKIYLELFSVSVSLLYQLTNAILSVGSLFAFPAYVERARSQWIIYATTVILNSACLCLLFGFYIVWSKHATFRISFYHIQHEQRGVVCMSFAALSLFCTSKVFQSISFLCKTRKSSARKLRQQRWFYAIPAMSLAAKCVCFFR